MILRNHGNKMSNYVENDKLKKLLVEYNETESREAYNKIGKMFLQIAKRQLNRVLFIKYSADRKEEMVSDAVYNMCKYVKTFDITKNNPFSYFTQVANNAALKYINDRKRYDSTFKSLEYIDQIDQDCKDE